MPNRPPRTLKGKFKRVPASQHSSIVPTQTLSRLTVIWTNNSGVPFNTAGFYATLREGDGDLTQAASFDRYGTVVFTAVGTPTNRPFTLRLYNRDGVLYRVRTIPRGVSSFVVIG